MLSVYMTFYKNREWVIITFEILHSVFRITKVCSIFFLLCQLNNLSFFEDRSIFVYSNNQNSKIDFLFQFLCSIRLSYSFALVNNRQSQIWGNLHCIDIFCNLVQIFRCTHRKLACILVHMSNLRSFHLHGILLKTNINS